MVQLVQLNYFYDAKAILRFDNWQMSLHSTCILDTSWTGNEIGCIHFSFQQTTVATEQTNTDALLYKPLPNVYFDLFTISQGELGRTRLRVI